MAVSADSWLSNRVFFSYYNLADHCCAAWNKFIKEPWTTVCLSIRDWVHWF